MPRRELCEIFKPGESPYVGMYSAGRVGYSVEETVGYCSSIGIPIRQKDIANWENGHFVWQMDNQTHTLNPGNKSGYIGQTPILGVGKMPDELKLSDFPEMPTGWKGTDRRFFPCTSDNKPMMQWGWKPGFVPALMPYIDAKVLSPVGWVGQNMLYQTFIVLDIDGVGHGCRDEETIAFGEQLASYTMKMEDPNKKGSFHLYFTTNRLIPVRHYPHAKIDLMGNAVNAAVYLKNKISNGTNPMPLTDEIWNLIQEYQKMRKGN